MRTFNRGNSLAGPSRLEMREIKRLVNATTPADYRAIATQFRKMKRVWIGRDIEAGMRRWREAEARLVESSL